MKKTLILLILLLIITTPLSVQAEDGVEVVDEGVEYTFGGELVFQIELESEVPVRQITLVLQAPGISTFVGAVLFISPGQAHFVYDLAQRPLPAFSNITYSYHLTLENGESVETPSYSFTYLDNR